MTIGAFAEPSIVLTLLIGGTLVNRNKVKSENDQAQPIDANVIAAHRPSLAMDGSDRESDGRRAFSRSPSSKRATNRKRELRFLSWHKTISSYNTDTFEDNLMSRILLQYPFLVEVLYWALIYWVYQLGRAVTAVMLAESTIHVARRHALELVRLEKRLHIFWEPSIQSFFLARPSVMHWINRTYSYVHIPASIFFLNWLYFVTIASKEVAGRAADGSFAGPRFYEARRRTMAMCNLLAFFVFTLWPCMPPRLLSDKSIKSPAGTEARSYGFVDTVHGAGGESSVWTQNRFCNQYAAMPSLHFGYALLIGVTIAAVPLPARGRRCVSFPLPRGRRMRLPSFSRLGCMFLGFSYTSTILVAIISTANHFILDAIAGAIIYLLGWYGNECLLNLLPVEDFILWCFKIHKPERLTPKKAGEEAVVDGTLFEGEDFMLNNV